MNELLWSKYGTYIIDVSRIIVFAGPLYNSCHKVDETTIIDKNVVHP